jgi:hypothetical protein
MHENVRIEPGYHIIDSQAWVCQRTSPPVADLTAALNEFIDHPVFDDLHIHLDTSARMQLWCAARGWSTSEETTHHHTHDVLSESVSVVLATGPDRCAYALVQIGHDDPDVHLDLTTDDDYWLQVELVDIVCSAGHRWTWLDHDTLLDDTGTYLTFREVFGRTPGAPYAECRDCVAYDNGDRDEICGCDGRHTIYCPTCDQRCRLELTGVPTYTTPGQP